MLLFLTMSLTGCLSSSKPAEPHKNVDPLLQACPYPAIPPKPWPNKVLGNLLKDYHAALKDCNDDKASLRRLLSEPDK